MVNLMLNLFVNHIVENYPAIDYIAKQRKEKKFLLTGKKANILGMMINQAQEDH